MLNTSDPIPFFGGEIKIIDIHEIHVYSNTCSLMAVHLLEGDCEQTIPMIFYQDAIVIFCPHDWQTVPDPFTPETVPDIIWVNLTTGHRAVMLNGMPYLPPFVER